MHHFYPHFFLFNSHLLSFEIKQEKIDPDHLGYVPVTGTLTSFQAFGHLCSWNIHLGLAVKRCCSADFRAFKREWDPSHQVCSDLRMEVTPMSKHNQLGTIVLSAFKGPKMQSCQCGTRACSPAAASLSDSCSSTAGAHETLLTERGLKSKSMCSSPLMVSWLRLGPELTLPLCCPYLYQRTTAEAQTCESATQRAAVCQHSNTKNGNHFLFASSK